MPPAPPGPPALTTSLPVVRHELVSMVAIWGLGLVLAILVEVFATAQTRAPWLFIAAGICVIVAFIVQLIVGQQHRFVARVAGGVVGAVLVIGIVALLAWIPRFIGQA